MPVEVNKENYEKEALNSLIPVLVDFWGPRCTHCLALMPIVEEIEEKYKDRLKVTKLDASQNRRLCMNLKVMGLPTFILYQAGKEIERVVGEITPVQLKVKVAAFMDKYK